MLLAELEIFHSRTNAPTRRVALGYTYLPIQKGSGTVSYTHLRAHET